MYSPKINPNHIPVLYHLGKRLKKPMTRLVDEAVRQYLERESSTMLMPIIKVIRTENKSEFTKD